MRERERALAMAREGHRAVDLLRDSAREAAVPTTPGKASLVEQEPEPLAPALRIEREIARVQRALAELERGLACNSFERASIAAAEIASALDQVAMLGPVSAELEALRARALPLLAQAPALSRAVIDEALDGASRTQFDRARDTWRAARPRTAEPEVEAPASEARPLGMLGHVEVAKSGFDGDGEPLPFASTIQTAFGRHDVSRLRAHTGPRAVDAARRLGARAYAFGDRIAFATTPDLHTAAHEAAHAIQQRAGVALKGELDEPGDEYEQHADDVADAVVAGVSAEPLLDRMAGRGASATSRAAVQREAATKQATKPAPPARSQHFAPVPQPPPGMLVMTATLPTSSLPPGVAAHFGTFARSSSERVTVQVIDAKPKVWLYIERAHATNVSARGIAASIDMLQMLGKLAVAGLAISAATAKLLTRSQRPAIFQQVGPGQIKITLSDPKDNSAPDFLVFAIEDLVYGAHAGDYSALRPLEGKVRGMGLVASRYEGNELSKDAVFAGHDKTVEIGHGVTVPGLRKLVFGERDDRPVYASAATKGTTMTLGLAKEPDGAQGVALSIDLVALFERIDTVLQRLIPNGKVVRKAITMLKQAAQAGRAVMSVAGRVLRIAVDAAGFAIGWSLEALLEAGVAAGRISIDLLANLLPWFVKLGDLLSIDLDVELRDPFPPGPVFEIDPAFVSRLARSAAAGVVELLGLAGDVAAVTAVKIVTFAVDAGKRLLGFLIELTSGKKKKRVRLAAPIEFIAKLIADLAKFVGKEAIRGADWFAHHSKIGADGVWRVFLDGIDKPNGNRVGFDLAPFVASGDVTKLALTETFLDGSLTDIAYGPTKQRLAAEGQVVVTEPAGAVVIPAQRITAPSWMQTVYGLPKAATLETKLIAGKSGVHVWSSVVETDGAGHGDKPARRGFDIELALPVIGKHVAKYTPQPIKNLVNLVDEAESKRQQRMVITLHDARVPGKAAHKVKATLSWSLAQFLDIQTAHDIAPEEVKLDDGTWALGIGKAVSLAGWDKPVTTIAAPARVASFLPGVTQLDVFMKSTADRHRLLLADHASDAKRQTAPAITVELDKRRLDALRQKLPRVPHAVAKHAPLALEATVDGVKIKLGGKQAGRESWVSYGWTTVLDLFLGDVQLADLLPDQANLEAKSGLALQYTRRTQEIPKDWSRMPVKELPVLAAEIVKSFGVTADHVVAIDRRGSKATGDRIAIKGAVFQEHGKKTVGWDLSLEVDALQLLSRFLPAKAIQHLRTRAKGGLVAVAPTKDDPQWKLQASLGYRVPTKRPIDVGVTATWTLQDLIDLYLHHDQTTDQPSFAAPSTLGGKLSNGRYTLELRGGQQPPKGTSLTIPGVVELLGHFMNPQIASTADLYLDLDLATLPDRMIAMIKAKRPLEITSAYLAVRAAPHAGSRATTYSASLLVEREEIVRLATAFPAGIHARFVQLLLDFVQNPLGTVQDAYFAAQALPLIAKHADMMSKIDLEALSVTEVATAMLMQDHDLRMVYYTLKTFDRLVEAGIVDKSKQLLDKQTLRSNASVDRERLTEFIDNVLSMSNDELKQMKTLRDGAGSSKQYNEIVQFYNSLPPDYRKRLDQMMALYDKRGIPLLDPSTARDWSPAKAIEKLARLDRTMELLESGVVGHRAEHALRGDRPEERDDKRATQLAEQRGGGKGGGIGRDVASLTEQQQLSLAKDGYVLVDGQVRFATEEERHRAALALLERAGIPLEEGKHSIAELVAIYQQHRKHHADRESKEAVQMLRGEGIHLPFEKILEATAENPRWLAKHGKGPSAFGVPALAVDSVAYVVHIARLQQLWQMPAIDGVAGPSMVKQLDRQKALGNARDERIAKGGGDNGPTGAMDGNVDGGDEDRGVVPIPKEQAKEWVYYDEKRGVLDTIPGALDGWKSRTDGRPGTKLVRSRGGETGMVVDIALDQNRITRDPKDPTPQIGYRFIVTAKAIAANEEGKADFFYVRSKKYVFQVFDDGKAGRNGAGYEMFSLQPLEDAIRNAVNGKNPTTSIESEVNGGLLKATIRDARAVGNKIHVVLKVTSAPEGTKLFDEHAGEYVSAPGWGRNGEVLMLVGKERPPALPLKQELPRGYRNR